MSEQKNNQPSHDEADSNNRINLPPEEHKNANVLRKNLSVEDGIFSKDNDDLFLPDYNTLQTPDEHEKDQNNHPDSNEKPVASVMSSEKTLSDRIAINSDDMFSVADGENDNITD